ncbi:GNAT family N-acetyltransferase [Desulfohalovibrio reitneri]|uniref:GNAT family N-acetyltransferase n=1 Tax=Desulfohalovibrio reitneri TaxID=1307759 RepID=UPI00068F5426|nr:GNAT family N-acetyltransferase [Desulfohalovibrio reitneri]
MTDSVSSARAERPAPSPAIRPARLEDAGRLLELVRRVEGGAPYLLDEVDELGLTPKTMLSRMASILSRPTSFILVAEDENERLVGYVFALGGHLTGLSHVSRVNGIGVLPEMRGHGVARALMRALEVLAREAGVRRLELKYMTPNTEAASLYESLGFQREGVERMAYRVGGEYLDAVVMAKLLPVDEEAEER